MPRPKVKDMYMEKRVARLEKQYETTSRRLHDALHYWKIRSAERNVLWKKLQRATAILARLEALQKDLAKFFRRPTNIIRSRYKCKHYKNNPIYPVYMSKNDFNRLKMFLNINRRRGKLVPHLTQTEYGALLRILKLAL